MIKRKKTLTIRKLYKEYQQKKLNFDFIIQRRSNIWDNVRKSKLIVSILSGYPVPPVYAILNKEIKIFLDGKQRLTTIFDFLNDGFKLDKKTKDLGEEVIANKRMSDLPINMQDKIYQYAIEVGLLEDLEEDEIIEIFNNLNNGVALNNIERSRPLLGIDMTTYLGNICKHSFFKEKINISKSARNRYADQDIALKCLKLIYESNSGFTNKEMKAFIEYLKDNKVQDSLKSTLDGALFYANEAFPKKETYLKKTNTPIIIVTIIELYQRDLRKNVPPIKFKEFTDKFFENTPDEYKLASISGSSKKENVTKRLNIFRKALFEEFNIEDLDIKESLKEFSK